VPAIGGDSTVFGSTINGEFVSIGEMMVLGISKSSTAIEGMGMTRNDMCPIHPGEILREEFPVPLGMTAHAFSQAIHVPATRVNDIVNGKPTRRDISIILRDDVGTERVRWNLRNAWPSKWSGPSFDATSDAIAIETLELTHEGVLVQKW